MNAYQKIKEWDRKHGTQWSDSTDDIAKMLEEYGQEKYEEGFTQGQENAFESMY